MTEIAEQELASEAVKTGPASVSWFFFHGAGGSTSLWQPIADDFGGLVMELPVVETVEEMADATIDRVAAAPTPRILVGNSLGALVALELSQRIDVAGMMLIAAGWEFPVSEDLIARAASGDPQAFEDSAKRCVSRSSDPSFVERVVQDFAARPPGTMAAHLRAIRDYTPSVVDQEPRPLTFVVQGEFDRSVSLQDHCDLASHIRGALIPLRGAAHMPFVDHKEEVYQWLERLQVLITSP